MVSYTVIGTGPWQFDSPRFKDGTGVSEPHLIASAVMVGNDLQREVLIQLRALNAHMEDHTRIAVRQLEVLKRMDRRAARKVKP